MADIENMTGQLRDLRRRMNGDVYALITGYPASCFARLLPDGLDLPLEFVKLRNLSDPFELAWDLYSDVRVFDETEETHFWRDEDGWHVRQAIVFEALNNDEVLRYEYPILGRRQGRVSGNWVERTENRGTSVWLPAECVTDPKKRPVLKIVQLMGENILRRTSGDIPTGLFGVVDAAIEGFDEVDGAVDEAFDSEEVVHG